MHIRLKRPKSSMPRVEVLGNSSCLNAMNPAFLKDNMVEIIWKPLKSSLCNIFFLTFWVCTFQSLFMDDFLLFWPNVRCVDYFHLVWTLNPLSRNGNRQLHLLGSSCNTSGRKSGLHWKMSWNRIPFNSVILLIKVQFWVNYSKILRLKHVFWKQIFVSFEVFAQKKINRIVD